jgi:hypothetical protein
MTSSVLALAARRHQANVVAFQAAEDAVVASHADLLNAFAASQKVDAVVLIDGQHYLFFTNANKVLFRKIEVLE